ncbi:MAG: SgcJ/EcaC family oxidoreductase [Vulcanimicrobiaceae bacterium]
MTQTTIERVIAAMDRRDAAGAAALFCRDGIFCGLDGHEYTGRAAIQAVFTAYFARIRRLEFRSLNIAQVASQQPVESLAHVSYRFYAEGTDGRAHERETRVIVEYNDDCIAAWREFRE